MRDIQRSIKLFFAIGTLGAVLAWSSTAVAEQGRGRADLSAEPQRSYGAIDVILYQTTW